MNERRKKLFVQLDDDMPGVRANALEALRDDLKKDDLGFRDLLADVELESKLAEYVKANQQAAKRDKTQRQEITALKAALWVKVNWKILGAVAAVLLVGVAGYCAYGRYWSRSEAVNVGLRAFVASASWNEGWSEPIAARVGGEPYWLMFRGDIDASSYSDNHGNPIEMRCLHVYAAPAQAYSRQFYKPSPRNFLGLVTWPELAMHCEPSPNQQANK